MQARDAIGRTWQMSTVQLDFNLPERFGIEYTGRDGPAAPGDDPPRAVRLDRAVLRVLLEHYAGAFPVWLSPVQVVGIPVAEEYADYLGEVIAKLKAEGVRAELDHRDDRMQKKIRTHTKQKVPFQLIAGEQDRDAGTVSFRFRDGRRRTACPIAEAVAASRTRSHRARSWNGRGLRVSGPAIGHVMTGRG